MAHLRQLNEQFNYNLMLAKALVQLLPANDRQLIRIWFDKLMEMDQDEEELNVRNEYIWFILLMLQCNKIVDYFKNLPPSEIEPLRSAIDQKTIDEILTDNDKNLSWLDTAGNQEDETKEEEEEDKRRCVPDRFLDIQPLPKEGIICYFGAFSDQKN